MLLNEVFDKKLIKIDLESRTKKEAFLELIKTIKAVYPKLDRKEMLEAIQKREDKMNTAMACSSVAVPHGYYSKIRDIIGAIGVSQAGIDYDAPDHKPVHLVFLILMGKSSAEEHLLVLKRILTLVSSGLLTSPWKAASPQEVYDILSRFH
ncbi:MAG: PTS sugar transporter subunit IIA [Treponema sp.]|jgi:PTS system fructose-specific IIA component|nr:PTS sugar transporter subunit IIA [Treponema sp.]